MAISGVSSSQSIHGLENGTDKLRGLENAAAQHAKHDRVVSPSVVVEVGRPNDSPGTYAPPVQRGQAEGAAKEVVARAAENVQAAQQETATVAPAEGASIKINEHVRRPTEGASGANVVLGEGASLKVNAHLGTVAGEGGTIVLQDGASLKINAHAGSVGPAGGTIVVGEDASVQLNIHATSVSGGTLVAADGDSAPVKIDAVAASNGKATAVSSTTSAPVTTDTKVAEPSAASLRAFEAVQPLESLAVRQTSARNATEAESAEKDKLEDPRWAAYRQIIENMQHQNHGKHLGRTQNHSGGQGSPRGR